VDSIRLRTTGGKTMSVGDGADGRLLRLDEVAQRLSISKSMAWKLVAYGQLRSVKIGRAVRVRPGDIEAYLASRVRET
jgi:excisionase family DNA binding protein